MGWNTTDVFLPVRREARQECKHGQLARSCEICELETEIAKLRADNERLRAAFKEWLCVKCRIVYPGPPKHGASALICPHCGGDTMPMAMATEKELREQIAALNAHIASLNTRANIARDALDNIIQAWIDDEHRDVFYALATVGLAEPDELKAWAKIDQYQDIVTDILDRNTNSR